MFSNSRLMFVTLSVISLTVEFTAEAAVFADSIRSLVFSGIEKITV